MKIKLVKPNGDQVLIDADFWEFSQGKYEDEDIVLIFYKKDERNTEEENISPSHTGVLPIKNESFEEDLTNIIEEKRLINLREQYNVSFESSENKIPTTAVIQAKLIETSSYSINTLNSIEIALKDLVKQEKDLDLLLKQINKPILILKDKDTFIIKETVGFEKRKE